MFSTQSPEIMSVRDFFVWAEFITQLSEIGNYLERLREIRDADEYVEDWFCTQSSHCCASNVMDFNYSGADRVVNLVRCDVEFIHPMGIVWHHRDCAARQTQ